MRHRWRLWTVLALASAVAGAMAYSSWTSARVARLERQLAEADRDRRSGRPAMARRTLESLSTDFPNRGEVLLMLGECQLDLGDPDRAEDAFERIPEDSPSRGQAALYLGRLRVISGRLSEAEQALGPELLRLEGELAEKAHRERAALLRLTGRPDEAREVYRRAIGRFGPSVSLLRLLWEVDHGLATARTRELLEVGLRNAPDDDRVWLGLAHHARIAGELDTAASWLDRCLDARPDDPAIWLERLARARDAGLADAAREALNHLPPDAISPARVLELASWFARLRGDSAREREALGEAIDAGLPDRSGALERLALLAIDRGDLEEASRLRERKAEVDTAESRYFELLQRPDSPGVRAELASSASSLSWDFEARAWARLAGIDPPTPSERPVGPSLVDLAAELDSSVRPGSAVPVEVAEPDLVRPRFVDRADEVGLDFSYDPGSLAKGRSIVEMMGGGVALLDFDGDGWLDVFVVQGGPFPPEPGTTSRDRLFRNREDGTFEDVTAEAGIDRLPGGYGLGATAGDFDDDGRTDLLVTRWQSCQVLRNRGDGTFEDATEAAGLESGFDWPTSAAFADLDLDGDLDLYCCQYLIHEPGQALRLREEGSAAPLVPMPLDYPSLTDRLFRNDGGRFVDVTGQSGVAGADSHGRGLGVLAGDLDDDARPDLYVANDMTANFLFMNRDEFRFEEQGIPAGVAADAQGGYQAGMGVALGDLDGDGLPDLAVTNFIVEGMTFYRNLGGGLFSDQTSGIGLRSTTIDLLGFGTSFLDANNDGALDLAATNGHVNDARPREPFAMPGLLMIGNGRDRLVDVTELSGAGWTAPRVGRGLAVGDLDNDGRLDVLLVSQDTPMAYLHNETEQAGRWLTILLEATQTAPSAIGARVTVRAGGREQHGWTVGGGSYQSRSDPRLHFGLGEADSVSEVEIRWPSGRVDRLVDLPANSAWRVREGDSTPLPLLGFPSPER